MQTFLRKALLKWRGSKRYDYLREYEQLQWQPLEVIEQYQFDRIKKLFNHAYDTVSYYRQVFDDLGIHPKDIKNRSDVARLPVLTKDIIRSHRGELVSATFKPEQLFKLSSGGSTGEPLHFYSHLEAYEKAQALFMLGLKNSGWNENERLISIWGNPGDFTQKTGMKERFKKSLSTTLNLNAYQYDRDIINGWIEQILEKKNTFIYGYVSVMQNVAEHIIENNISVTNVKGVMTSAEKLHDWQRSLIQKAFNCKAFDQYGSREVPGIASECPAGKMHQFLHSAYVEYLPVPDHPENLCKLVVTSLVNDAMPFIRYEIGDFAMPGSGQCSCGRGFPLLDMKIGRIADRFLTSRGKTIYGTFFVRQMYDIEGIKSFQFHQINPQFIRLSLIKNHNFNDAEAQKILRIESKIKQALDWDDLTIDVQYVEQIPKTIGGKHRYIISDVTG
ncbi:phenylacetate--CoA ligase family protein [Pelovirga terrestris]|uniref:Phenylacetate--CoA ligase family protein n=1 Tax=Pelovirga terrestris TaxID=2771352 RepID=A0A8J6QW54_9BACT|nr:phenylacetate--CoA ligase family protein [Pelovirga terrestris]MBD1399348.1 phenylacetate--CoA ligase family protein [Pelovirga terrestris]